MYVKMKIKVSAKLKAGMRIKKKITEAKMKKKNKY